MIHDIWLDFYCNNCIYSFFVIATQSQIHLNFSFTVLQGNASTRFIMWRLYQIFKSQFIFFVTKEIFISSCFFFSWITCFDTFNEIVKIDITYYWYLYSYWYYFLEGKRWYFVFWRFYSITDVHTNVFYVCWSKFFRSQPRGIKSSPRGNS